MLRAFCLELGLRVWRRKYVAYQSKAGYLKLLVKKLAAKRRDIDTSPLLDKILSPKRNSQKCEGGERKMKKRAASSASIGKANRLLKELGSRAAAIVDAELTRCLKWLTEVQREEDEEDRA
ncbi:hypothetical protein F442_00855 [Phytophthora nicotianae P10297]|uniref:Uncharacterized protein n=5 Tax=Phytophthora nicotianae TaxID=4792 RepID=V9FYS0_PHYNI|nr:hypothetical protein F443_00901 [Phytophthora nicotianae P1569]ETO85416.1 hypothetical protein F444_00909 [Phytophthora nicotianae P1976]ETP54410.1 hypothetical protein F442_00855 [Phytophthora nicotianae P10297]